MRIRITNARLIDGTGAPARPGEVTIEDDRIAEVGGAHQPADETVDLGGAVLAPGFIDMHSHGDFVLPIDGEARPKILQGVTTEVVGNCGLGLQPANSRVDAMYAQYMPLIFGEASGELFATLADYRAALEGRGVSVNAACLIPHGNVRCMALGLDERAPTSTELDRMREAVGRGMDDGAFGLSTGLIYPPGVYAQTDEIVALCRVVAEGGGLYATHMRDEGNRLVEAVAEALRIGEQAGVPVQISHHKAAGRFNWGKVRTTLAMVDAARAAGRKVHSDVYPYAAGSTILAAIAVPPWAFEGSQEAFLARLRDPANRARIVAEGTERLLGYVPDRWYFRAIPRRVLAPIVLRVLGASVTVSSCKRQHDLEGKTVAEIARARRRSIYETILDLLVEEDGAVAAILHAMSEEDVRTVLAHEATVVGTDGFPTRHGKSHPRTYGTFPRVLVRYVRDEALFSLEEAVHRMTGLAAEALGAPDLGVLRPGAQADLVAFAPERLTDPATYEQPERYPEGIDQVWVRGVRTVRAGRHTGARAGRVLRRPAKSLN